MISFVFIAASFWSYSVVSACPFLVHARDSMHCYIVSVRLFGAVEMMRVGVVSREETLRDLLDRKL